MFLFVPLDDDEDASVPPALLLLLWSWWCRFWSRTVHSSSLIRPIRRSIPDGDGARSRHVRGVKSGRGTCERWDKLRVCERWDKLRVCERGGIK